MRQRTYVLLTLTLAIASLTACVIPDRSLEPYAKQTSPCFNCGTVLEGQVTAVLDGDTLELIDLNNQEFRVRLQGIDAPEKTQAYGPQAKALLTRITLNQTAHVIWNEKDKYGRIIGKVLIKENDICLEMIAAGLAWHFTRYEQSQSEDDRQLYKATEKKVREQRKGLWADINPQPPWKYRHQQP